MKKLLITLSLLLGFTYAQNIPCTGNNVVVETPASWATAFITTNNTCVNTFGCIINVSAINTTYTWLTVCPDNPGQPVTINVPTFTNTSPEGTNQNTTHTFSSVTDPVTGCTNLFLNVTRSAHLFTRGDGQLWRNSTINGNPAYTATVINITSNITASCDAPLPVTFAHFNGNAEVNGNYLNWFTFTEENSLMYVVQASTNASTFDSVGAVGSNNMNNSEYEFLHLTESPSTLYRLKHIDFDGYTSFSPTIEVNRTNRIENVLTAYPSPFTNYLIVCKTGKYTLKDLTGKVVLSFEGDKVNTESLSKGIYILSDGLSFVKVVK